MSQDTKSQHTARDPEEPTYHSLRTPEDTQDQQLECRQSKYLHSEKTKEEESTTEGIKSHKTSDVGQQSVCVSAKLEDTIGFQDLQFGDLDSWGIDNNTTRPESLHFIHVTRQFNGTSQLPSSSIRPQSLLLAPSHFFAAWK